MNFKVTLLFLTGITILPLAPEGVARENVLDRANPGAIVPYHNPHGPIVPYRGAPATQNRNEESEREEQFRASLEEFQNLHIQTRDAIYKHFKVLGEPVLHRLFDAKLGVPRTVGRFLIEYQSEAPIELTFEIKPGKISYSIAALGTPLSKVYFGGRGVHNCISLELHPKRNQADLRWVNSDPKCGLNAKKLGTELLKLVDLLVNAHGVRELTVVDGASISCDAYPEVEANLWLLYLLKTGTTWYEKSGFVRGESPPDFAATQKRFRSRPLSEVKGQIQRILSAGPGAGREYAREYLMSCMKELTVLEALEASYKRTHQNRQGWGEDPSLAEFLQWVWKADCRSFEDVTRVLFQDQVVLNLNRSVSHSCAQASDEAKLELPWMLEYSTLSPTGTLTKRFGMTIEEME